MRSSVTGIMVCVPTCRELMTAPTVQSLYSTAQYLTAKGIRNNMAYCSASDIGELRNLFLTMWYDTKPEYSHMLFIDDDMGWEPGLIHDMIKFDEPLMGVLYAKRKMQPHVIGTVAVENHSIKDVKNGFIEATDLGAGVLMIRRDVVDTMLREMPYLSDEHSWLLQADGPQHGLKRIIRGFDPIKDATRRLSEDVSFCHRWKECGGKIWANVRHKISHIGTFDYHLRYEGVLEKEAAAQAAAASEPVAA